MRLYLYLGLGGAAGVILRFALGAWVSTAHPVASRFPIATLLITVSGSFALGFLMRGLADAGATRDVRAMLTSGFCGGFTTFSTFSYETIVLMSERRYSAAAFYGSVSLVASVAACYLGFALAEVVARRS